MGAPVCSVFFVKATRASGQLWVLVDKRSSDSVSEHVEERSLAVAFGHSAFASGCATGYYFLEMSRSFRY